MPDKNPEARKEYYKKNRTKILERTRRYTQRPQVKARLKAYQKEYRQRPEVKERTKARAKLS